MKSPRMRRSRWWRTLCLLGFLAAGCVSPDHAAPRIPVGSQGFERVSSGVKGDRILLVFLPGRGTTGKDFLRQGFLTALNQVDQPSARADAVTVDLTYPYYQQRIASQRLHEDVIAPAHAAGYRQIRLVGVSMGGLGAIFYDHDYPGEITGIVAIAPFLGEKNVVKEIELAGGLERWEPRQPLANDDFQRRLWLAIRAGRYGQTGHLPLTLAYGTADRFAYGHRLLAANLPPGRVIKIFGFHDWATWRHLWEEILRSDGLPLTDHVDHVR